MESSCFNNNLSFPPVTDQYSRTLEFLSLLAYSSFCASWFLPKLIPVRLVKALPYYLSEDQKRVFLGRLLLLLVTMKRKRRPLLVLCRLQDSNIWTRRIKRCSSSLRWPRRFRGETLIILSLFLVNLDYCWMMFRGSSLLESWPLWWENLVLERYGLFFNAFAFTFLILIFFFCLKRPLYWMFLLSVLEPVSSQGTAFSMVKLCLMIFRLKQVIASRWTLTCLLLLYARL